MHEQVNHGSPPPTAEMLALASRPAPTEADRARILAFKRADAERRMGRPLTDDEAARMGVRDRDGAVAAYDRPTTDPGRRRVAVYARAVRRPLRGPVRRDRLGGHRPRGRTARRQRATTADDGAGGDPDPAGDGPRPTLAQARQARAALAHLGWSATPGLSVRRSQAAWLRTRQVGR